MSAGGTDADSGSLLCSRTRFEDPPLTTAFAPRRWLLLIPALLGAWCAPLVAAPGYYQVEVLVFRHRGSQAEPREVDQVRGFHELFDLDDPHLPEAPLRTEGARDSLNDLWRRLERRGEWEPLAAQAWVQTQVDYHPRVRLHDDEVIAEELHFPSEVVYVDLRVPEPFAPFVAPMYRLDGWVQLRRSRFLHVAMDLEYRVDDPAWARAFPTPLAPAPAGSFSALSEASVLEDEPPEPFRIHRLRQSRQIEPGEWHYFDAAFLGALVRVRPVAAPP